MRRFFAGALLGWILSLCALALGWRWFAAQHPPGTPAPGGSAGTDSVQLGLVPEGQAEEPEGTAPAYVLVLGVDERPGDPGRSDTMLLLRVGGEPLRVLSLPRDTRVTLEGVGVAKLNAAYAWGGPELATRAVSELLGLPVEHYVKVNLAGFRRLVDLIGGVPMHIEAPMRYVDPDDGLVIDLRPGHQVLDGARAEQYVRFRNDAAGDDLSRIRRQQQFLRAAARRALQPANLPKLPALLRTAARYVDTNLPLTEQIRLATIAIRTYHEGTLVTETLPGYAAYVGPVSYFLPDTQEIQRLREAWLPPHAMDNAGASR
ncbi:LCP family protein [Symbiobacterium thermophilum]|uniref:Cell envelope-related transcriptional attenuator domain-containing protein n=1 Tax=Symbiobacterium thermophilum TaxID=2734 RepID=A0A953LJD9_SYMTR|nr:LCP family protein [Symbiobacterium thermophilum]MBY6277039.1 hypothetical protein [Symbiobacterium thermophilum]